VRSGDGYIDLQRNGRIEDFRRRAERQSAPSDREPWRCDRGARSEGWQRHRPYPRRHGGRVGVDSAIECPGIAAGLNISVEAARDRGAVVQAGRVIRRRSSTRTLAYEDITIEATWCYEITMWSRMISSGKLPVEKIITGRIEPEAIVDTGSARCSIRRHRDEGDG
jgi:threonine dehydrogenase-like Zn-dependent dehydrogenase